MQSGIYEGFVKHRRYAPVTHEFRSRMFMMYLDLDEISTVFEGRWLWSIERPNIATFRRRDHTGQSTTSLEIARVGPVRNEDARRGGRIP